MSRCTLLGLSWDRLDPSLGGTPATERKRKIRLLPGCGDQICPSTRVPCGEKAWPRKFSVAASVEFDIFLFLEGFAFKLKQPKEDAPLFPMAAGHLTVVTNSFVGCQGQKTHLGLRRATLIRTTIFKRSLVLCWCSQKPRLCFGSYIDPSTRVLLCRLQDFLYVGGFLQQKRSAQVPISRLARSETASKGLTVDGCEIHLLLAPL